MIAKYNGKYFCVDFSVRPIELWKYEKVEGFEKCIDDGLVYYRKFVNFDEIDEIFEVGFSVCWDGQWCGIDYSPTKEILTLITNNGSFGLSHNMYEFERGVYAYPLPASDFMEFRMWKRMLHDDDGIYTMLNYNEFKMFWEIMETDLFPPRKSL